MSLGFRKTHSVTVYIVLLAAAIWALPIHAQTTQEKQLEKLKQTIEELKKDLAKTRSSRDEVNKALETTEKEISNLSKKANNLESTLKERQQKLDTLRDERSHLNNQKRSQEALVSDYVNAAYRLGQQGNLRLLLNQEDPTQVSRNLKYYDYIVSARAEKITDYMTTVSKLNAIEPEIAYQRDLVQTDFDSLRDRRKELANAQGRRKQALAKLDSRISTTDQQLRDKNENRRQLEKLLSRVIQNIASISVSKNTEPFAELKGKLPWPTNGKVVKKFGSQRIANKMRWEGMLIASNEGEPVQAVHYGRVIFSDYLRGHGLLMIVDHGGNYLSLYAHNQALYKVLGEWVESGETIASVGNSGGQQRSALYFELRYKGKPTNPQKWFKRA